jgi:hypothetical protein
MGVDLWLKTAIYALRNNPTQVPLQTTIEAILIPLAIHSTFSGKG